jgi:hypothetical protein
MQTSVKENGLNSLKLLLKLSIAIYRYLHKTSVLSSAHVYGGLVLKGQNGFHWFS